MTEINGKHSHGQIQLPPHCVTGHGLEQRARFCSAKAISNPFQVSQAKL